MCPHHPTRYGGHDPHRNTNTPLAKVFAIQLNLRVLHQVIVDSERVDSSPETPARPIAHRWVDGAGDDEDDKVADVGYDTDSLRLLILLGSQLKKKMTPSVRKPPTEAGICQDASKPQSYGDG